MHELLHHSLLFQWDTIVSTFFRLLLGDCSIFKLVPDACYVVGLDLSYTKSRIVCEKTENLLIPLKNQFETQGKIPL